MNRDNALSGLLPALVLLPSDQKVRQVINKANSFPGVILCWGTDTLATGALPALERMH